MTTNELAALFLVLGVSVLVLLFGTKVLVDWRTVATLPPQQRSLAVGFPIAFAGLAGLALCVVGLHLLLFGVGAVRYPYGLLIAPLIAFSLAALAAKRRFMK